MKYVVLDIEGNSLNEVTIDKKGDIIPEVTRVHCVATKASDSDRVRLWLEHEISDLKQYLAQYDTWIGHNIIAYDLPVLRRLYGFVMPKNVIDTVIVSKVMYPDFKNHALGDNTLGAWGKHLRFTKMDFNGPWDTYTEEMGTYCCNDTLLGEKIFLNQFKYMKDNAKVIRFEHEVAKVLAEQTEYGFNYDLPQGDQLHKELLMQRAEIADELNRRWPPKVTHRFHKKTGKPLKDQVDVFNPGSRQQIAERLKETYGYEFPATDKGNPSVNEETLKTLDYPEVKILLEYFKIDKLLGQVTDWNKRAAVSRDGRIHGVVNPGGCVTGRCSHSQPNVSQVDKDPRARALWIPTPGRVLVGADLAGQELRCLCNLLNKYDDGKYMAVLLTQDIHAYNQSLAGLETRNQAKTFIYGYLYGGGVGRIMEICNCSKKRAQEIMDSFESNLQGLEEVKKDIAFEVAKYKGVYLPLGRYVPVRKDHVGLNCKLQGTAAEMSKLWVLLMDQRVDKRKARQVLFSHDETQWDCDEDYADELCGIVKKCASLAGEQMNFTCPIEAGAVIGKTWKETH